MQVTDPPEIAGSTFLIILIGILVGMVTLALLLLIRRGPPPPPPGGRS